MRLPQPAPRNRPRREIVLRQATAVDAAACALIDGTYSTTHIWQLDSRQDGDELRVSFRQVRLPRELTLIAPHRPPALPPSGQRRDLLWIVAEEREAGAAEVDVVRPWSHAVRRSATRSSVQLSLPVASGAAELLDRTIAGRPRAQDAATPASPKVVGYVAVAAAPRDETAYLRSLVVDRAFRRQGVGARLLAEAKRWAVRQGAGRLTADVQARNYPALRLLQKASFAFCGFNDCCYPDYEVAVFFSTRLR